MSGDPQRGGLGGWLSIFTVLERLGLKLEATRGLQGRYVIDHIERPSEN